MARCSGVSDGGISWAGIRERYPILTSNQLLRTLNCASMERLWTPWRRAFIEDATSTRDNDACFLCTLPAEADDRANHILFRSKHVFVVLNRYPYNSGHLMIAPYAHTGDFERLESSVACELMEVTQRTVA